ncbi:MAG: hypothetical protein Q7V57_02415 [Actinomycetota bacterium]|nr:hypothetical protein [Actinomycetota bacterium]
MNSRDQGNDHGPDNPDDGRIDDLARAAGRELRRPAPPEGLARVQTSTRRRRVVRAAAAGGGAVVLLAAGVLAFTRGDDDHRVVPAETTVPTTVPTTDPTTVPTTVVTPTAPDVVYATTGSIASPDYLQHVIDPKTGAELRTETPDSDASRAAQEAQTDARVLNGWRDAPEQAGGFGYRFEVGDIVYGYVVRFADAPDLPEEDPDVLALYDRCGQAELTIAGATGIALPPRVHRAAVSLDRHWIVTVSSECPTYGTLVGQQSILGATATVKVFDAAHPEAPGTVLMTAQADGIGSLFFSPDARYLAVEGGRGYRVFDLSDNSEVEFAPGECGVNGGRYARFAGPWVGDSTLVLALDCPTLGVSLLVVDVATGDSLEVQVPVVGDVPTTDAGLSPYLVVEVDGEHFSTPANAWYTMCELAVQQRCWYGQGSAGSVLIPDAREASFLPLGFTYGG